MYSCIFKFQFRDSVLLPERMRLLAQLFELSSADGCVSTNIYWYTIKHTGEVKFWSDNPKLTNAIEHWLYERENKNLLVRISPRWPKEALGNA